MHLKSNFRSVILLNKLIPPICFSYGEVQFLITPERGRKEGGSTENGDKGITQK